MFGLPVPSQSAMGFLLPGPFPMPAPGFPVTFMGEEPKPKHSYIGLISMAILSTPEKKMLLGDIYQWILDNYPYFRTRGTGWRNSVRHNLSLNDFFLKSERAPNGKGHFWAVHPANVDDFSRGDFDKRRAQRFGTILSYDSPADSVPIYKSNNQKEERESIFYKEFISENKQNASHVH